VSATFVTKSALQKLTLGTGHMTDLVKSTRWLHSYGIPVRKHAADNMWLHLSNALPFYYKNCSLPTQLRLKSLMQLQQFNLCKDAYDVVSGESQFTLDQYSRSLNWRGPTLVLRNGLAPFVRRHPPKEAFAIVVGTESYKRLDRTIEVFEAVKARLSLNELVIVGHPDKIAARIKSLPFVKCRFAVPQAELEDLYEKASLFISTSEVENSSVAVLEGLQITGSVLVSAIPSHLEMLDPESEKITIQGLPYVFAQSHQTGTLRLPTWTEEIEKMLDRMRF
jgi:glycosyltransferase involved in cell wall biosynthesis